MASVLIHAALLAPLLCGGQLHRRQLPDSPGAPAEDQRASSAESMLVVFVDDSNAVHDLAQIEADPSRQFLIPTTALVPIGRARVSLPDLSSLEDHDEVTAQASGTAPGHALLFGRYMGQIAARVNRAWLRPRASLPTGSFACRVQITQDRHGYVQEITLQQCNEDPRWQVSLVHAIQSASPLPAPPDPAVFSSLVTMQFDSPAYVQGQGEEGFELPVQAREVGSAASVDRRMRPDGSVDLRITGIRTLSVPGPAGESH